MAGGAVGLSSQLSYFDSWDGEQVVSSEWIEEAPAPQTQDGSYGYYFWHCPAVPTGPRAMEARSGLLDRVVGAVVD